MTTGAPCPADPWVNVPTKRRHFIGRDEVCTRITQLLTFGEQPFVSVDASGGVGKSALAAAVAYSDTTRAHFADGVLWASLGENPDIARLQKEWADAIPIDIAHESDPHNRIRLISTALASRHILVVLDDVWVKRHADLLTLASPSAAHLLTTRTQSIAQAFAPNAHLHLAYLDDESSFKLLRALAPEACDGHELKARAIAVATGGRSITLTTIGVVPG